MVTILGVCHSCHGTGKVVATGNNTGYWMSCPECGGSGNITHLVDLQPILGRIISLEEKVKKLEKLVSEEK